MNCDIISEANLRQLSLFAQIRHQLNLLIEK